MTQDEVIEFMAGLPGIDVLVASEAGGAPEAAWGDAFFYYDPERDVPVDRRMPIATIVVHDYDGFDEASDLNRPGVFRINVAVGRQRYEDLVGHPPAAHAEHHARYDYTALDQFTPHPVYAAQGWISILNPSAANSAQVRSLLTEAHARAAERHHRSARKSPPRH